METLEDIASDVSNGDYRTVYQQNLQLHKDALAQMGDDPATVYGVVVTGTNQAMGRTATSAQVRYVDLPEDPADSPEGITFTALLPEDTKTSSVGSPAEAASSIGKLHFASDLQ